MGLVHRALVCSGDVGEGCVTAVGPFLFRLVKIVRSTDRHSPKQSRQQKGDTARTDPGIRRQKLNRQQKHQQDGYKKQSRWQKRQQDGYEKQSRQQDGYDKQSETFGFSDGFSNLKVDIVIEKNTPSRG